MESKKKFSFSLNNNIPRNLFPKNHSFSENKKYSSKERQKNNEEIKANHKLFSSFVYFHKPLQNENKKEENIKIDSSTEVRLPKKYLDWSYDNPKNE